MASDHELNPDQEIERLICVLCSLVDGEGAIEPLVSFGHLAVPRLLSFLVDEPPRTIPQPRCWAVQALGRIGAFQALRSYLRSYTKPVNNWVGLAEDSVRSAAAMELCRVRSEENLQVLLGAARQRASLGLVRALGDYRRSESIPLLFDLLDDDICRDEAYSALLKVPREAEAYAILLLRGRSHLGENGSHSLPRRRATLKLLNHLEVGQELWPELECFLADPDADCVLATARIGLRFANERQTGEILLNLFYASSSMNGAQELETTEILDAHAEIARQIGASFRAMTLLEQDRIYVRPPFRRLLRHVLGTTACGTR